MNLLKVFNPSISKRLFQIHTSCASFCIKQNAIVNKLHEPADKLMDSLKNTNDIKDLLKEIRMHSASMNNSHTLQALRSLLKCQKDNNSNVSIDYLKNTKEISILESKLLKISPDISINEVIEIFKFAVYFKLNSHSLFIQSLLQLIRYNVNQLSLQSIIFLSFLLNKLEKNALIEALNIALPIVFDTKIPNEIDYENIDELVKCLKYISSHKISQTSTELIMRMISERESIITPKLAFQIHWALCGAKLCNYQSVLDLSMNILKNNFEELEYDQNLVLLRKMTKMYQEKRFELYNEELFTKLTNYFLKIAKDENDLNMLVDIIPILNQIRFEHEDMSKFIIDWYDANPEKRNQLTNTYILELLTLVTMGDVNHPNLHNFLNVLLDHVLHFKETDFLKPPWLKTVFCFAKYKIYNRQILKNLFSESFIEDILKDGNNQLYFKKLLLLKHLILVHSPENKDVLPDDKYFNLITSKIVNIHKLPVVKEVLDVAFGDKSFVLSNLKTDYGYIIDYVIVMKKTGYPLSINVDKIKSLKDIEIPDGGKIIAIMMFPSSCYLINSKKLINHFELFLSTLEHNNILTLTIALDLWKSLPNHEKVAYVLQAIKLKFKENDQSSISNH